VAAVLVPVTMVVCGFCGLVIGLAAKSKPTVEARPAETRTIYITAPGAAPATTTLTPTPTSTTEPAGPKSTITGDGTFLVGVDVVPGQYRTTVPASSRNCYWARLSGTSGSFDELIANENTPSGGQAVVTIAASDKAFKTSGCGSWQKIG
jgi:hypothetical protein